MIMFTGLSLLPSLFLEALHALQLGPKFLLPADLIRILTSGLFIATGGHLDILCPGPLNKKPSLDSQCLKISGVWISTGIAGVSTCRDLHGVQTAIDYIAQASPSTICFINACFLNRSPSRLNRLRFSLRLAGHAAQSLGMKEKHALDFRPSGLAIRYNTSTASPKPVELALTDYCGFLLICN